MVIFFRRALRLAGHCHDALGANFYASDFLAEFPFSTGNVHVIPCPCVRACYEINMGVSMTTRPHLCPLSSASHPRQHE